MNLHERSFLRDFFRNLRDDPLSPGDERYVPIYSQRELAEADPVELLARGVEWSVDESVQLFSGFRGTGKSTELRRLKQRLEESGYTVVLCDVAAALDLATPVDPTDFLLAVAGLFGDSLASPDILGRHPGDRSYWERFAAFLTTTRVDVEELGLQGDGPVAVQLKAGLKRDPAFKEELQHRMAGHLGAFVDDLHGYMAECVEHVRRSRPQTEGVVLLVDSVEKIRGVSANAEKVHSSVETLFAGHADKLHLPALHVVYTAPPYLRVKYPNVGRLYAPGGLQVLPAVKVSDERGEPFSSGLRALEEVVARRGDVERLFGAESGEVERLARLSGGHLRDLLGLVAEVLRRAESLPVSGRVVDAAIEQIRSDFLPLADEDARWLHRVSVTHTAGLGEAKDLPDLARFLDTHLMVLYRNGHEWYDVHPLIADEVREQVDALEAEDPATS